MLTRTIIFMSFLLTTCFGWAQFTYPIQKDAEDFQKRQVLVHLFEEDENVLKAMKTKLGKNSPDLPKKLEAYSQQLQHQNEILKAAISRYWKASRSVEFKTKSELEEILSESKTLRQYAVLEVGWRTDYHSKGGAFESLPVFAFVAYVAEATDRKLMALKKSPTVKTDYIFKVAFPTDNLQLSDYIFAVHQFNFHLKNATAEGQTQERYRQMAYIPPFNKAGYELLKKKTLMLPLSVMEGHTPEEVKAAYTFPSDAIDNLLFEEAVEQQFSKYAYLTKVWSDRQANFTYVAVGASEGIILVEMGAKGVEPKVPVNLMDASSAIFYKNEIGVSLSTLAQLQHLLAPQK